MTHRRVLLASLAVLLANGCSNSPKNQAATSGSASWSNATITASKRQDVVIHAMAMLDRSYTYGGKKLHTGFDCSGLVSFVFKESAGISIKGSAHDIATMTQPIQFEQANPGDLVFFNTLGSPYSHVGIYIGSGKFIHAANEKTGVKVERLNSAYWAKRFQGFRTVLA